VRHGDQQERIAVGRGVRRELGGDGAAGASPIVDHHLPAEPFAELGGDDAPDEVDASAGSERNKESHRLDRVVLRSSRRGEGEQQTEGFDQT
jgi:hypothetical protein